MEGHTNAKGLTLVTDDRHLAMFAKDHGVKHIKIEEFLTRLSKRQRKNAPPAGNGKPTAQSGKEFSRLLHIFEKRLKENDQT